MEVAKRIARPERVAPEPVELAAVDGVHHTVRSADAGVEQRLADRHLRADEDAVAIDARPGHSVKPFRDVDAIDLQRGRPAGRDLELFTTDAEAVFGISVPVAGHMEKDRLVHQPWLMERGDAVAIRHEADAVNGFQLDERDAVAGLRIDHGDCKRLFGFGRDEGGEDE